MNSCYSLASASTTGAGWKLVLTSTKPAPRSRSVVVMSSAYSQGLDHREKNRVPASVAISSDAHSSRRERFGPPPHWATSQPPGFKV